MTTLSFTEGRHNAAFIMSEAAGHMSRENANLASGVAVPGMVLGETIPQGGTAAASYGAIVGTGNGVLTPASPSLAPTAKEGVWKIAFTAALTNLGTFEVIDPDGLVDGVGNVGTAYTGALKFTIADGSTDFTAGSYFPVTVTRVDNTTVPSYAPLNLSGTDGSQIASAIAIIGADATSAVQQISILRRLAEVNVNILTWPAGITTAQKEAALVQLRTRHIIAR